MDVVGSVAIAGIGSLAGVLGTVLASRRKMAALRAAAENDHMETFFKTVNKLLTDQAERHSTEIASIRKEQIEDSNRLGARIDMLQDQARQDMKQLHVREIEVARLTGQVNVLQIKLDHASAAGAVA